MKAFHVRVSNSSKVSPPGGVVLYPNKISSPYFLFLSSLGIPSASPRLRSRKPASKTTFAPVAFDIIFAVILHRSKSELTINPIFCDLRNSAVFPTCDIPSAVRKSPSFGFCPCVKPFLLDTDSPCLTKNHFDFTSGFICGSEQDKQNQAGMRIPHAICLEIFQSIIFSSQCRQIFL